MKKRGSFFLICLCLVLPGTGRGLPPPSAGSGMSVTLSSGRWSAVLAEFEEAVFSQAQWMEKTKADKLKIQGEIEKLEANVAVLRKETSGANVFGEIRLKGLLNELKAKLEENSHLQHQWDEKQKEFEQKALSLIALYNDRIEAELENSDPSVALPGLDPKLNRLTLFIQKRNRVQYLLGEYRSKNDGEKLIPLTALDPLKSHDRENLQLALDLFSDRKRDLSDQLEKWSIEEDQAKNELKLQGKMQDFLEDIRQINEDSDLPRGGLKHNDLDGLVGVSQKNKLENRIGDLQLKISRGQSTLSQISQLMDRVQIQMDSLNERKPK